MARHVRQLDLRNNLASSIADKMNVVPGFKTSAGKFLSLCFWSVTYFLFLFSLGIYISYLAKLL